MGKKIKITINVTHGDIEHGEMGSCSRCPIARSLLRHARKVSGGTAYANSQSLYLGRYKCNTPAIATQFMRRFDKNGPRAVQPFHFTVEFDSY